MSSGRIIMIMNVDNTIEMKTVVDGHFESANRALEDRGIDPADTVAVESLVKQMVGNEYEPWEDVVPKLEALRHRRESIYKFGALALSDAEDSVKVG